MKSKWVTGLGLSVLSMMTWAATADLASVSTVGDFATILLNVVSAVSKLLFYAIIVCGIAFLLGAIVQYKNHRANPQQVRLTTPVTFLIIAIVLIGFPLLLVWLGMGRFFGF